MNRRVSTVCSTVAQDKPFGPGGGITGRDSYLAIQALAYAIETIEHLPKRWQEYSNQQDMIALLAALVSKREAYDLRLGARSHIEQRGVVIVNNERVLAPIVTDWLSIAAPRANARRLLFSGGQHASSEIRPAGDRRFAGARLRHG